MAGSHNSETEIKIAVEDFQQIRRKLAALGFRRWNAVIETAKALRVRLNNAGTPPPWVWKGLP